LDHSVHLDLTTGMSPVNPMEPHPSLKMKPARRQLLFAAATRAFTAHGFEQASLNRIIGEIGMSKSSFYHYFANKTELFQQIVHQAVAPFAEMIEGFTPEKLSKDRFWPAIMAITNISTDLLQSHPEVFQVGRMFHRNLHQPNGICEDLMVGPMRLLTRTLEHGKVIGAIRDDLPSSLLLDGVVALGMATDRWVLLHTEQYTPEEFEVLNSKILGMFIRILAPDEG